MDYTLRTLASAFSSRSYIEAHQGFPLYAVLLASSLDREFVLEYLSFFHELHYLTGRKVLVIGPEFSWPGGFENYHSRNLQILRSSDLEKVRCLLQPSDLVPAPTENDSDLGSRFLDFMHRQTRESYAFAEFIGLRTDLLPCIVFFESLFFSSDYIVWQLSGKTGREFVTEFRSVLEELSERCGWRVENHIQALQQELRRLDTSPNLLPSYSEHRRAADRVAAIRATISFYEDLHAVRTAYDRVAANPGIKVPLENVGRTLAELEGGRIRFDFFVHLEKHCRRWKTRLPPDYRDAVRALRRPRRLDPGIRLTDPGEQVSEYLHQAETVEQHLSARHQAAIAERRKDLLTELENARYRDSERAERPLDVLRTLIGSPVRQSPSISLSSAEELGRISTHTEVPRVFISYSHDSQDHKRQVLELAQQLRRDGIDCWVDQFEQGPRPGFPRWAQQQIAKADFVLLVCSALYRARFEGNEEAGTGLGVRFESQIIVQELYDNATLNTKFIPVILAGASRADVPTLLRGFRSYQLPVEYRPLHRHVTRHPEVSPVPLGPLSVFEHRPEQR